MEKLGRAKTRTSVAIKCGRCKHKVATWHYEPCDGDVWRARYLCDDCVPRGCSCNVDETGIEATDERGRLYPCCEYDFNERGYAKKSNHITQNVPMEYVFFYYNPHIILHWVKYRKR